VTLCQPDPDLTELTRLLAELRDGRRGALDEAVARMYGALRQAAARQLARERPGHTLYPTALVHEAYLRLADSTGLTVQDRQHFIAVAARAMRQVLVDHARQRRALKRGGGLMRTTLHDKDAVAPDASDDELVALDAALVRLGAVDDRARTIVEYRFFAGLTEEQTAELLGLSARTVRREWVKARAWLHATLAGAIAGA
jgi:RNA polymerase sigma factor (TIGR02999 family)